MAEQGHRRSQLLNTPGHQFGSRSFPTKGRNDEKAGQEKRATLASTVEIPLQQVAWKLYFRPTLKGKHEHKAVLFSKENMLHGTPHNTFITAILLIS